jgi:hypothetical protein
MNHFPLGIIDIWTKIIQASPSTGKRRPPKQHKWFRSQISSHNVFGTLNCNNNLNQHFFVLVRRKNALVRSFKHGISGFAARLTAPEAQSIAKKPGAVSVFPDPVYHLHTTRSWDFLKYGTGLEIISSPNSDSNLFSQGSDTSVGFLDSGERILTT